MIGSPTSGGCSANKRTTDSRAALSHSSGDLKSEPVSSVRVGSDSRLALSTHSAPTTHSFTPIAPRAGKLSVSAAHDPARALVNAHAFVDIVEREALSSLRLDMRETGAQRNLAIEKRFQDLLDKVSPNGMPAGHPRWLPLLRTAHAFLDPKDKTSFSDAADRLAEIALRPKTATFTAAGKALPVEPISAAEREGLFGSEADREAALIETLPRWLPKPRPNAADAARVLAPDIVTLMLSCGGDDLKTEAAKIALAYDAPASQLPDGGDWLGNSFGSGRRAKVVSAYANFVAKGGSNLALPEQLLQRISSSDWIAKHAAHAVLFVAELIRAESECGPLPTHRRLLTSEYRGKILSSLAIQSGLTDAGTQQAILNLLKTQLDSPIKGNMAPAHAAAMIRALISSIPNLQSGPQSSAVRIVKDALDKLPLVESAHLPALLHDRCKALPAAQALVLGFFERHAGGGPDDAAWRILVSLCHEMVQSFESEHAEGKTARDLALSALLALDLPCGLPLEKLDQALGSALGGEARLRTRVALQLTEVAAGSSSARRIVSGGASHLTSVTASTRPLAARFTAARYLIGICRTGNHLLSPPDERRALEAVGSVIDRVTIAMTEVFSAAMPSSVLTGAAAMMNELSRVKWLEHPEWARPLSFCLLKAFPRLSDAEVEKTLPDVVAIYGQLQAGAAKAICDNVVERLSPTPPPQSLALSLLSSLGANTHEDDAALLSMAQQVWGRAEPHVKQLALIELYEQVFNTSPVGIRTALKFIAGAGGDERLTKVLSAWAKGILAKNPSLTELDDMNQENLFGSTADPLRMSGASRSTSGALARASRAGSAENLVALLDP